MIVGDFNTSLASMDRSDRTSALNVNDNDNYKLDNKPLVSVKL